jgi:Transglycosylase SLT domain
LGWFLFFSLMSMSAGKLHTPLEIPMKEPSFVDRIKHIESRGRRFGSDGKILQGPQTRYGTAKGEMQVLDGTARDPGYGVAPAKNGSPEELARVGAQYAEALLVHFGGDEAKAGAAYNYGPGNVQKLLSKHGSNWMEHLPKETKNYVASLESKAAPVAPLMAAAPAALPEGAALQGAAVQSGPVALPPEMLARLSAPAPAVNAVGGPDAWQTFLKSMPGRAQPVNVADIDYGNPRTATRMPEFQLTPVANRRPNFEAFGSWTGRAA